MSTMVDSKIGKTFQRSVGRAKEKILQNLGKVDRTADEILDDHINSFSKQQYAATRLQKELNNYIRCIRACATSSRALLEAVNEVYEPEWGGKELLTVNSQSVELLWNDFAHRLAEQVLIPLNTYQGQFPEMRKKIEKRGRKLVDFDGERHALQAMQSNPRRGEAKLARQRESLEAAKRTYDILNSELHEELPALFNSRIVFLVSAMSTLFASEHIFHSESSKVFTELESIVEKLAKEAGKGTMNYKVPSNAVLNSTSDSSKDAKNGNISPVSNTSSNSSTPVTPTSPVSKLSMEETNGSLTRNGIPKSNGSIKPDTNPEMKSDKDQPQQPVNGVDTSVVAVNQKNSESANPVITPSTPTALSEPSTTTSTPAANEIEASKDNPKASPPTVNGTNNEQNNDGANKATTPSTPEKEEPGTITASDSLDTTASANDTGMTTETKETHPEQDDMTLTDHNLDKGSIKERNENGTKGEAFERSLDTRVENKTVNEILRKKIDEVDELASKTDSPKIVHDENNNDVTEKGVDVADLEPPQKPLHGILSNSKNRLGNGRMESPEHDTPTSVPAPNATDEEPGVLYRVRATYRYQKEDVDELSFEAGEIIRVVEYDDPEEQEEGWLMGIKDNGEKGMFPANFTRPL